jgi:hypothetical protein
VKITTLAMAVVTAILSAHFVGRLLPPLYLSIVHDWLPAVLLFVPYWQVGQFHTSPNMDLQRRLAAFDSASVKRLTEGHGPDLDPERDAYIRHVPFGVFPLCAVLARQIAS